MTLLRLVLAFLTLLLPLAVQAQPADQAPDQGIEGAWDLQADGTTVFRFEIGQAANGEWQGRWLRPETFNSDGNAFYNIRGGTRATTSMTALTVGDTVELGFDDPRPGAIPDIFSFRLTGPDSAEMVYVGTDLAPYALVRASADDAMGPWDAARIYRREVPQSGNEGDTAAGAGQIDFDLAGRALATPAGPVPAVEQAPEEPQERSRIEADFLEGF
ncbi:hypothetical protein M3P36_04570 [Altererythrobacter sp. KTW20L]|uniref:hypothetical protein n=1 Tax=Altererythrobacter sp. KTW20L TaxID=2942210 RepID=UPI0020C07811|nr:hypothetical protein [Altererythrobacter sp. KTW20L]MCL6250322.1 hypothetical protein [Altererythrobacter sp. KTW20L]